MTQNMQWRKTHLNFVLSIEKTGIIFVVFLIISLVSCSVFKQKEQPQPELPPPVTYYPTFIRNMQPITKDADKNLRLEISRYRVVDDENVELYFHLIENNYTFASGAATPSNKSRWCGGKVITSQVTIPIEKLLIKEIIRTTTNPFAFIFVLDHSGSMGYERAYGIQQAVADLIRKKAFDDIVAVIKYDHTIDVEVTPTQSSDIALSMLKINGLDDFGGWTAINDAILTGIKEATKIDPRYNRVVIVFTDGWENASSSSVDDVIREAKANNVIICGIDYGYNVNYGFIENYARSTSGIYKHIYRKEEFDLVFQDIVKRFEYSYHTTISLPEFGKHKIILKYCLDKNTLTDSIEVDNTPNIGDVTLLNVYFDFNKYSLKPESFKAIKRVAKLMKAFPTMIVEIAGHTDSINRSNDPNYNIVLSELRAQEVKKSLINEGIEDFRIIARGYGETRPIADNSTEEGRAKNRRTEFIIIRK